VVVVVVVVLLVLLALLVLLVIWFLALHLILLSLHPTFLPLLLLSTLLASVALTTYQRR
jgi:hypothetical protein